MLSNYYTFRCLSASLNANLRGSKVVEAFSQNKDELVLTFALIPQALVISCNAEVNSLYFHPDFKRARRNSADIFSEIWGHSIESVSIHPSDRVITFRFDSGIDLLAQFFGPKANIVLVDSHATVLNTFRNARHLRGTTVDSTRPELMYDITLLGSMLDRDQHLPVRVILKRAFPVLGSTLATELLHRAGIPPAALVGQLPEKGLQILYSNLRSMLADLDSPAPRIFTDPDGNTLIFSIIALRHIQGCVERRFDDIHEALRFFVSRRHAATTREHRKSSLVSTLSAQREKDQRTCAALTENVTACDRAATYENFGKILLQHLAELHKGDRVLGQEVSAAHPAIPLDPRLSPVQNAQSYFEKAKHARRAAEKARQRLQSLQARIDLADVLLTALDSIITGEELTRFLRDHAEELQGFGVVKKGKSHQERPFRVFTVEGGFEVWAGKSSSNNDLLTLRHTAPNDLWFHVRGTGGSHVVLKVGTGRGTPGKHAKQQAASIAAYYSKMKTSSLVPVAMTLGKYVRKPKGSPPGTVVLHHESVLFAEPSLPGAERND